MDKAALYSFLSGFRYGVVSSIGPDGEPQSALVGIAVTPELEIVFDTVKPSRKYANLAARPSCSFVVGGWDSEQTVQFEGMAAEPVGAELERVREAYFAVWPDGRDRLSWPGLTHFAVRPRWIRFSDFGQGPPLIVEMSFPAE
jgi:pyridoxine/pyridoxamine 5'-phosphate oxidase